jgi:hypothetical protein
METVGLFAPESAAAARDRFAALGPTAQVVVKETAKAMEMDADTYRESVTSEVVETARDAMFASMLEVHVGTRAEFEAWCDDHPDFEVIEQGNENVERVAWHPVAFEETVVAATFQSEQRAAVDTLRRQAFGRIYREVLGES